MNQTHLKYFMCVAKEKNIPISDILTLNEKSEYKQYFKANYTSVYKNDVLDDRAFEITKRYLKIYIPKSI